MTSPVVVCFESLIALRFLRLLMFDRLPKVGPYVYIVRREANSISTFVLVLLSTVIWVKQGGLLPILERLAAGLVFNLLEVKGINSDILTNHECRSSTTRDRRKRGQQRLVGSSSARIVSTSPALSFRLYQSAVLRGYIRPAMDLPMEGQTLSLIHI